MELQGKDFKELWGKMELRGRVKMIFKSYGVKWSYGEKYKGFIGQGELG